MDAASDSVLSVSGYSTSVDDRNNSWNKRRELLKSQIGENNHIWGPPSAYTADLSKDGKGGTPAEGTGVIIYSSKLALHSLCYQRLKG